MINLAATPLAAVEVLIADTNRMQAQLLTSALRRRPEFSISTCLLDSVIDAIAAKPARVVLVSLNHSVEIPKQMAAMRRLHLSNPELAKVVLMESYDREIVITAFRSGVRGIFCVADTHFRLLCRCIQRVADGQIWANTEQLNLFTREVKFGALMKHLASDGEWLATGVFPRLPLPFLSFTEMT